VNLQVCFGRAPRKYLEQEEAFMSYKKQLIVVFSAVLTLLLTVPAIAKNGHKDRKSEEETKESKEQATAVLWRNPDDIKSRNLFYGPGGDKDAPHTTYTFEKEDMDGTSPKFIVRDENGVKWKVKMGPEARPETVASRLVWAVGYSTNEDYFLPALRVEEMPEHLRRGQKFVGPHGTVNNVRLKRYLDGEKKVGYWKWSDNPFTGTRELGGLRVLMALINNWDLKDNNTSIFHEKHPDGSDGPENIYMVSDIGASFGTTGVTLAEKGTDGNFHCYSSSRFVRKVTPTYVDFATPSSPVVLDIFYPPDFFMRMHMRWIGRHIPRENVKWIGQILAQLSPEQIRDAFRAAGYTPDEVEGFAQVVEKRIGELGKI
jgi:hypothetical protein